MWMTTCFLIKIFFSNVIKCSTQIGGGENNNNEKMGKCNHFMHMSSRLPNDIYCDSVIHAPQTFILLC